MRLFLLVLLTLLFGGCASDSQSDVGGSQCPGELQVKINEGLHFGECRVLNSDTVPKIAQTTADLLVFKNKDGFDFWSGTKDDETLPLRKLTSPKGPYKSLDEVPFRKPIASRVEDAQGRFFNVTTGSGLVVQNNVTAGWTKVWVKQVIPASELVIIQFETF